MSTDTAPLPPIGTPLAQVQGPATDLATRLKRECLDVRETYVAWADEGRNYYHYGTADPAAGADGAVICNDIQNAIIVQTDIQTKEPPTITLEAVDNEAAPLYFHNLPPAIAAQLGLPPNEAAPYMGPDGEMHPPDPLSPPSVQILMQAGAAGMIPPNAVIAITSGETADFFQKIFDVYWNRSAPDEWYWDNTLLNAVDGWCPPTYEFDDEGKRHIFNNLPIRQFFCDPTTSDVQKMAWVMPDIVYRADIAKKLFPDLADEIDLNATPFGKLERPPNTFLMGSQYEDVAAFQTPMVTLTVLFLRDQECFHTPESAEQDGLIQKKTVGTGQWTPSPQPDAPDHMQEEMREGLFHRESDEEVFPPGHDQHDPATWPTYHCIRQLTMIGSRAILLADTECKYWDFPCALNINIPIIGKPFGIGEPFRQRAMQNGRSRVLTAMVDHVEMFPRPITWAPKSARELLPEDVKDGFEWGMHLWVDDDTVAKTQGKVLGQIAPPTMPAALMAVDDKLKREINDSGGNMAAIQGQEEQLGKLSGVAIAQIQQGASSLASFKARRMQAVVKRMARLAFHSVLTRTGPSDWKKITKRYPDHVLEAFAAMGADLEWSIKVDMAAGTGATLAQKKAEAKDNFKSGLASRKTTQEAVGLDPQMEEQRQGDEMAQQARITMQNQPAAGNGAASGKPPG